MNKDLLARLLAERFVNIGAELVEEGVASLDPPSDDPHAELERWENLEDHERHFFQAAMQRLVGETFIGSAITVTQGDSLLLLVADSYLTKDEAHAIKDNLSTLFDGVKVNVLVAGGVSVIKGQQPLCGASIGEPVWTDNNQELNEQAQAPCIIRGEHPVHENKHGVKWIVNDPDRTRLIGGYKEQNGSEHPDMYERN